jgi:hypothetical protein
MLEVRESGGSKLPRIKETANTVLSIGLMNDDISKAYDLRLGDLGSKALVDALRPRTASAMI